jgi:hypothetical protein
MDVLEEGIGHCSATVNPTATATTPALSMFDICPLRTAFQGWVWWGAPVSGEELYKFRGGRTPFNS